MTGFGEIKSETSVDVITDQGYDEVTAVGTTAAALEDITGLTFDLTIPTGYTGRIAGMLMVQCSTSGGSPATGEWAVEINSVDGTPIQRYLSGVNDMGALAVQARSASLSAGTYTLQGRHRRVSGASTVVSDVAQLMGWAVLEAKV